MVRRHNEFSAEQLEVALAQLSHAIDTLEVVMQGIKGPDQRRLAAEARYHLRSAQQLWDKLHAFFLLLQDY